jgi:hypothetical protein
MYTLKSKRAIQFYDQNKHLNFDNINELFTKIIQDLTSTMSQTITGNDIKTMLHNIQSNLLQIEQNQDNVKNELEHIKRLQTNLGSSFDLHKQSYITETHAAIEKSKNSVELLQLIRDTNDVFSEKINLSIKNQIPLFGEGIVQSIQKQWLEQQKNINDDTTRIFQSLNTQNITESEMKNLFQQKVSEMVHCIESKHLHLLTTINEYNSKNSSMYEQFNIFIDKQKNSSLKGKESEQKLGTTLTCAYPDGNIINQSGEAKSCDYKLTRTNKKNILFENKDYANNVPDEEIKKFIRDIEEQKCHGIMLSQHSGIINKSDFHIDIHGEQIIVYVHFVNYDDIKIKSAVNMIDHLDKVMNDYKNDSGEYIPTQVMEEINKEYKIFVSQKTLLIENIKRSHKEQLKQLDEFDMPKLTELLNTKYTNVDQLTYPCTFCNAFSGKNKRALASHQKKCKKINENKVELL